MRRGGRPRRCHAGSDHDRVLRVRCAPGHGGDHRGPGRTEARPHRDDGHGHRRHVQRARDLIEELLGRISLMEFSGSVASYPRGSSSTSRSSMAITPQSATAHRGDPPPAGGIASPQAMHMIAADMVLAGTGDLDAAREHSGARCARRGARLPVRARDGDTDRCADRSSRRRDQPGGRAHARRAQPRVRAPSPRTQVNVLENLAVVLFHSGHPDDASRLIGACEEFRRQARVFMRVPYLVSMLEACTEGGSVGWRQEGASLASIDVPRTTPAEGRGTRGRPGAGWDALTPSELKVITLVAEGGPDQEVAGALFVSLATVKTHLTHVFQKLGIRNRTQLVRAGTGTRPRERPVRPTGATPPGGRLAGAGGSSCRLDLGLVRRASLGPAAPRRGPRTARR